MIWKIEVVWERGKSKKHTETVDSFQLFLKKKKTNQLNAVSSCASVKFLSLFLRQTMKLKHKFPYFAQFFNGELTRSLPQNPPNFIRKGKTMRKQLFTSLILEISFDSLSLFASTSSQKQLRKQLFELLSCCNDDDAGSLKLHRSAGVVKQTKKKESSGSTGI